MRFLCSGLNVKPRRCNCRVCRIMRPVERLARRGTKAERAAVNQLLLEWEAASTDAVYWRLKYRGEWPDHA